MAQARPVKEDDPNQIPLEIQGTESVSVEEEQEQEQAQEESPLRLPSSTTQRGGKKRIRGAEKFANLPVSKTTVLVPHEVQQRPDQWQEIGEETTYEVIVEPAKLSRHKIVRKKYRHAVDRQASPIIAAAKPRFCSDYASSAWPYTSPSASTSTTAASTGCKSSLPEWEPTLPSRPRATSSSAYRYGYVPFTNCSTSMSCKAITFRSTTQRDSAEMAQAPEG
jgi:hypothetical protein